MKPLLGMKIYSYDWYWKYGLSYKKAADILKEQGVDFVASLNQYIPTMNTAVKEAEVPAEFQSRFNSYSDVKFREAVRDAGIEYYCSAVMFFDPAQTVKHDAVPVDHNGNKAELTDWYIGVCPSSDSYVDWRIDQITKANSALDPDGIFLQFFRWPGFWETWLPGTDAEQWPEFCFCERCIDKFEKYAGIKVPRDGAVAPGVWIRANVRKQYTGWKAHVLRDIIIKIKKITGKKVMINTLAFDDAHFGDARARIFGQDIKALSDVVDMFEVMGYHQILGLPGRWVAQAGIDVKEKAGANSRVVCTVQGKPDYLTGMHAGKGRQEIITLEEFADTIQEICRRGIDGVMVYAWSDFLQQKLEQNSTKYIDLLKDKMV